MQHQQHALAFMLSREKAGAMPAGGMLADDQVCQSLSTLCIPRNLPGLPCEVLCINQVSSGQSQKFATSLEHVLCEHISYLLPLRIMFQAVHNLVH